MSTDDDYPFLTQKHNPILQNFIGLTFWNEQLDITRVHILNYFLKHPNMTAHDLYKFYKIKFNTPKTPSNHARDLFEKKFLELVHEKTELIKGMKTKFKKPYRLSLNGIFYVILNTFDIQYGDLIISPFEKL